VLATAFAAGAGQYPDPRAAAAPDVADGTAQRPTGGP
jgi:hypothetical protein